MNNETLEIFAKHGFTFDVEVAKDFNKALIEICELQKKHDIKIVSEVSANAEWELINNAKNIAE